MTEINTHNLIVDFGKHKGERWTRVPRSYLSWLVNEPESRLEFNKQKEIAQAELNRRGTVISKEVEISNHAIDTASMRVRKTWHKTKNKGEGLYSWLVRMATEALATTKEKPDRIRHLGIDWVFKHGKVFPLLKTVIRKKDL